MSTIKLRLTGFALAIVLVALLIAWAAHSSWRQVTKLSDKLTGAQIASFQTADYFQASLQELNYTLLRFQIEHDQADRERFLRGWNKLNLWIDVQRPTLTTAKEGQILDQINAAYDDYLGAATNLLQKIEANPASAGATIGGFEKVESESKRLLGFAYQLVDAHRESLTRFLADSQKSLGFLLVLIFSALFVLLILGVWLAGMV